MKWSEEAVAGSIIWQTQTAPGLHQRLCNSGKGAKDCTGYCCLSWVDLMYPPDTFMQQKWWCSKSPSLISVNHDPRPSIATNSVSCEIIGELVSFPNTQFNSCSIFPHLTRLRHRLYTVYGLRSDYARNLYQLQDTDL